MNLTLALSERVIAATYVAPPKKRKRDTVETFYERPNTILDALTGDLTKESRQVRRQYERLLTKHMRKVRR